MSDRKYRHRGYQDSDRDRDRERERREQRPAGDRPQRMEGGPRGRGLGAPAETAIKCARCGRRLEQLEITPETTCPGCGDPLHSCTNCTHFNTAARFECRKPIPARVESKTKANACEFFEPKSVRELGPKNAAGPGAPSNPNDPRAAFDALFKKK
jgi:predicted RNA-binding Zn-ribbon protein involved in translation (DUF1610 family)